MSEASRAVLRPTIIKWNRCAGAPLATPSALPRLMAGVVFSLLFGPLLTFAQGFQMGIEQFDSWIFEQHGNENGAREALESKIDLEIRRIEQSLVLSEDQKNRVRLGGRGDIKRFFNRVAHARNEFRELELDQNNINEAYQLAMPLQQELAVGLFEDGSLFAKVLRTTLAAEQRQLLQERESSRRKQTIEAYAKSYVTQLEMQLPMTAAQRDQLLALANEKIGKVTPDSLHLIHLMQYHMSQLPEEELEEIFDAGQLNVFRKVKARHAAMAPFLRQQGLLDDLDD